MSGKGFAICMAVVFALVVCPARFGFAENKKTTAPPAHAQAPAAPSAAEAAKSAPQEKLSVTHHSLAVKGETLNYTATAGYLKLKDEAGKPKADMFFVAYTKDPQGSPAQRPVTFLFNGGPGAASVWLNLGAVGPRRVLTPDPNNPAPPPYQVVDNEYTWLGFTDLVFIDPVGTGFSRPEPGEDAKQFYGVKADLEWVGSFIRLYTTRFDRWLSPKFLAGESYGTFRAAALAQHLFESYGMDVNGILLVSLAIDFQMFSFELGNDLPYELFLPTYTAAAWYHKRLPQDLLKEDLHTVLGQAEAWALGDYTASLARGDSLAGAEREKVVDGLMRFTGLSREYIENHDLRIDRSGFMHELLRDQNLLVGLMDSSATGFLKQYGNMVNEPGFTLTVGPYTAVMNDYLRRELKFETDLKYEFLAGSVFSQWNWGSALGGYVSVLDNLEKAIKRSKHLKVFAASGYYDLDVPYLGARYCLDHLGLNPALQKNITIKNYESGHQLYTHEASLKLLASDVAAFYKDALPQQ